MYLTFSLFPESTWEKPSVFSSKGGSPTETNEELVSQPESHSGKEAPNTKQFHASKISFRVRNYIHSTMQKF